MSSLQNRVREAFPQVPILPVSEPLRESLWPKNPEPTCLVSFECLDEPDFVKRTVFQLLADINEFRFLSVFNHTSKNSEPGFRIQMAHLSKVVLSVVDLGEDEICIFDDELTWRLTFSSSPAGLREGFYGYLHDLRSAREFDRVGLSGTASLSSSPETPLDHLPRGEWPVDHGDVFPKRLNYAHEAMISSKAAAKVVDASALQLASEHLRRDLHVFYSDGFRPTGDLFVLDKGRLPNYLPSAADLGPDWFHVWDRKRHLRLDIGREAYGLEAMYIAKLVWLRQVFA